MTVDRRRLAITAFAGYLLVAAVHLVAQVATAPTSAVLNLTDATQWLLMPLLALGLWAARHAPRPPLVNAALIALGFSWLGDALPDVVGGAGDASFLTMVGCFLVAQLAWIAAFHPFRERSFLSRSRLAVGVYAACLLGLVVLCLPGAGGLFVPVLIYGVCLTVMAILSSGLGRVGALGGALFFVSDSMIAIGAFAPTAFLPHGDVPVMLTYIAAQALLVSAVLHHTRTVRARPQVEQKEVV